MLSSPPLSTLQSKGLQDNVKILPIVKSYSSLLKQDIPHGVSRVRNACELLISTVHVYVCKLFRLLIVVVQAKLGLVCFSQYNA